MRFLIYRTPFLPLVGLLLLVPGCAPKERIQPLYPPVADLRVEAKPLLDPSSLGSEAALDAHDVAVETWGMRGWNAVARLCEWAAAHGMLVDCRPKPPDGS